MEYRVDGDFARFGSKSYAINKINSVELREHRPFGTGKAISLGVIAAALLLGGAAAGAVPAVLLGAIVGYAAWRAWQKSKRVDYHLFLMTSSSEAEAIELRDRDEALALRDQIERAMVQQSRPLAAAV